MCGKQPVKLRRGRWDDSPQPDHRVLDIVLPVRDEAGWTVFWHLYNRTVVIPALLRRRSSLRGLGPTQAYYDAVVCLRRRMA